MSKVPRHLDIGENARPTIWNEARESIHMVMFGNMSLLNKPTPIKTLIGREKYTQYKEHVKEKSGALQ